HLLLVEDNASTREGLTLLLQGAGYSVTGAANGRQALDYLHLTQPPFVILLDLVMPVMNGWQFRREQQKDPALAHIPVVVLSSESDLSRIAASLGVAGYLSKPVEFAQLLDTLRLISTRNVQESKETMSEGQSQPTLLVVEDNEVTREGLAVILRRGGY